MMTVAFLLTELPSAGSVIETVGRVESAIALTVIVTSSLAESIPSVAVRRRMYVPAAENVTFVEGDEALPKVTMPGPLTFVQIVVTTPGGFGKPSSITVPSRFAEVDKMII